MTDAIWETFDDLFKTVYRQGRMIEGLEARINQLERRLDERSSAAQSPGFEWTAEDEMPIERAA